MIDDWGEVVNKVAVSEGAADHLLSMENREDETNLIKIIPPGQSKGLRK